jgi:hypothetical protein
MHTKFLFRNVKGRHNLGELGIDGWISLIVKAWGVRMWITLKGLWIKSSSMLL